VLIVGCALKAAEWPLFEAVEPHMGTLVRIQLHAPDMESARGGFERAFRRIRELNQIFSDYDPQSELARLKSGPPVKVSPELFALLELAQRIARDSGGGFDVTVGALSQRWRAARKEGRLLSDEETKNALAATGFRYLRLDRRGRTVQLMKPGMRLDAGGIAKGYAADEALRVLRKTGLPRALVAVGGDLAIGDAPPGKKGWTVLVEPRPGRGETLVLRNRGVSTSGDREQFLQIAGRVYSHIVNPRTGRPLTGAAGVSAIARRAVLADALATALSVVPAGGWERSYGVQVLR
jgi:thiamine biosynthesis lipoprotein